MATKVRNTAKIFHAPALPNPPAEYNVQWQNQHNAVLRYYFANLDDAVSRALQFDTSDIIDGSIPDSKLEARYLRKDQNDETTYELTALEFIGDLRGAVVFKAKAGEDLTKGDVVYISGISGNTTVVSKADANDSAKMPAFGLAAKTASNNTSLEVYTFGTLSGIDTSSYSEGDELFVSDTAGQLTATAPTGESSAVQKIAKVTRSHASAGSVKIMGAGRTNATPNLNDGNIFMGNASNIATTVSFDTKVGDYITANPITNAQLAGSIENSKLVNDSVSYGGVSLDLGQSDATPAFDLSDATGYPAGNLTGTILGIQIAAGAIVESRLADDAVTTVKIADDAVTNAKIADDAVDTAQIADDAITTDQIAASAVSFGQINTAAVTSAAIQPGAVNAGKITGPVSSRHSLFRNVASTSITTTAATTFYSFSIPAPESGTATQGFNMVVNVRFQNTSASAKNNHQFRITPQLKSKTNVGTSIGTATYVSSPSSYNAIYYVSGDVTDILSSGYGGFAPNSTASGMTYGDASMVEHYYSSSTNRTYFRISLFPNATTVLAGVETFFSKSGFTSSGTWVNPNNFYNDRRHFPASSTQSIRYPMVRSVGRESTATELRLQFDHATSTTSLGTYIELIEGYCENIV